MPGALTFNTTADGASVPTERLRIDSIGTIKLYGDGGNNVKIYGHDGSSLSWILGQNNSDDVELNNFRSGNLLLKTNGSEKLRISSAGHVTKPQTPAFHVSRTAGNVGANNYVVFNTVSYNNGSHYNNSDGKFTAPVTGIYFFSAWHFTGGTSAFSLRINGSQFGEYAWDDTGGCATWVCSMNANQYAQIYAQGYTWRGSPSYHNGFCGYLIG